jgi:hypothetical protein
MGKVIELLPKVDRAELARRERAASDAMGQAQRLWYRRAALEDELAEAQADYDRADAATRAAWREVYALFGGDCGRYLAYEAVSWAAKRMARQRRPGRA